MFGDQWFVVTFENAIEFLLLININNSIAMIQDRKSETNERSCSLQCGGREKKWDAFGQEIHVEELRGIFLHLFQKRKRKKRENDSWLF